MGLRQWCLVAVIFVMGTLGLAIITSCGLTAPAGNSTLPPLGSGGTTP